MSPQQGASSPQGVSCQRVPTKVPLSQGLSEPTCCINHPIVSF